MIEVTQKGDFRKLNTFLEKLKSGFKISKLDRYAQEGVEALAAATPVSTGKTSESWGYTIDRKADSVTITWTNSNVVDGANIALLIEYGHATRSGTWIEGIDYITPAFLPTFIKIVEACEKEVRNL